MRLGFDSDSDLDARIDELIDRGLSLYGGGDLQGAMSAWRHALALDSENRRAADYVAYVKRHFDIVDEDEPARTFAPAAAELEIPFGLAMMGPTREEGIDAYESFEVSGTPKQSSAITEFEEEVPTRVRNAALALEIDQGWSLEGDEGTRGGRDNPLIETRSDRAPDYAELELESQGDYDDYDDQPDDIDLPGPATTSDADANRSTMLGFPQPPRPAQEDGRSTAELSPLELGEALAALSIEPPEEKLELDLSPPTSESIRPQSLSDVEFDLGDSSAEPGDFDAKPYASVAILGEEQAIGDAAISFRSPAKPGFVEVEPTGSDLESQLAELEMELETGSRKVEWTKHQGSSARQNAALSALGGAPELVPLEPRTRTPTPTPAPARTTEPPVAGSVASIRSAITAVVDAEARAGESVDERTRRRIVGLLSCAEKEISRDEVTSAAVAADMALEESPESALGQKLVHEQSDLLVNVFRKFLGDPARFVAVALPLHELAKHELDHRTAFLLSRVDGTLTIEDILDVSGMARLEAYRSLARLVLQGILEVR